MDNFYKYYFLPQNIKAAVLLYYMVQKKYHMSLSEVISNFEVNSLFDFDTTYCFRDEECGEDMGDFEVLSLKDFETIHCFDNVESLENYILHSYQKATAVFKLCIFKSDSNLLGQLMEELEELDKTTDLFKDFIIIKVYTPSFIGLCPYIYDLSGLDLSANSFILNIAKSGIDESAIITLIAHRIAWHILGEDYDVIFQHNLSLLPPGLAARIFADAKILYDAIRTGSYPSQY